MEIIVLKLETVRTVVGTMLLATDDLGRLRALDWQDYELRMHRLLRLHYGRSGFDLVSTSLNSKAREAIEAYFGGDLNAIDSIAVETAGTEFQRSVWSELRNIPVGQTVSYGSLAVRINRPKAVRAVGLANGSNPIGIVIPCHRVIGADSSLTGYGGGIERKRWLLEHEGALQRTALFTADINPRASHTERREIF